MIIACAPLAELYRLHLTCSDYHSRDMTDHELPIVLCAGERFYGHTRDA